MLSPNWASLWSSASQPKAYGTADLRKIAILMTDGEYNTQYDTNGVKTGFSDAGAPVNGDFDDAGARPVHRHEGQGHRRLYGGLRRRHRRARPSRRCRIAPPIRRSTTMPTTASELKQAFRDIALKLSSLYLSK